MISVRWYPATLADRVVVVLRDEQAAGRKVEKDKDGNDKLNSEDEHQDRAVDNPR